MKNARLGDVVETMKNGLYKPASEYGDDGIPCLRMYNIDAGRIIWRDIKRMRVTKNELADYGLCEGDLLANRVNSRELVGKTAVVSPGMEPSVFESKNIRVRLNKDRVRPKFINYQLLATGRRYFAGNAQQVVGMASISQKQLADFPIVLADLDQQDRIVAEIEKQFSRLDEAVANLKRVKANLKRYKVAVLKAAVEGRLVPTEAELARKERRTYETGEQLLARILQERRSTGEKQNTGKRKKKYIDPQPSGTSGMPELSEGWTWTNVGMLLREPILNGLSIKGSQSPPGLAALKLDAMTEAGFDYSKVRFLPIAIEDVEDITVQEDDFFISRGNGSLSLVGRGTTAQTPPFPVIFPDTMMRLRFNNMVRETKWLNTIWLGRAIRTQIERRAKTTAGIYKISQPQVESIAIPLPPPAEQQRIVAEIERLLSITGKLEAQLDADLRHAESLRQSILAKAFCQTEG